MDTLVLIPARGGSKGVPNKNIKLLMGKPLIYYTLDVAIQVFDNSEICVSTDDDKIADEVNRFGLEVPFKRPAEYATDTASSRDVIMHAIRFYESKGRFFDKIVLLQPTSPFRNKYHVEACLSLYTRDLDMVVSVKQTHSNPYFNLFEENEKGFLEKSKPGSFARRQDCPKVWEYNGAIYVINTKSIKRFEITDFGRVKKSEMDSISSMDIDNELDWIMAESILNNQNRKL